MTLPCSATGGQTYGDVALPTSTPPNDQEASVEAVLAHVLGPGADLTPLTGEIDVTKNSASSVTWSYSGEETPAYVTVKGGPGFALVGVLGETSGTIDVSDLLGHAVAHVRVWKTSGSLARPIVPTAEHGEGLLGNARLGKIVNGHVPCMHVKTLEVRNCRFTRRSGTWIDSTDGRHALTGQGIKLDGRPGGLWTTGGQLAEDGTVPTVAVTGHDGSGVATAESLIGRSVTETLLSPYNASGQVIENWSTRWVCGRDNWDARTQLELNPDLIDVQYLDDGVECYKGLGAGLNDPYGQERDGNGVYYPDLPPHDIWDEGKAAFFPAAKRPNTTGYYPGRVAPRSSVVWRPVISSVAIAN